MKYYKRRLIVNFSKLYLAAKELLGPADIFFVGSRHVETIVALHRKDT